MDDPEDDPWNSPDVHKHHNHSKTNGASSLGTNSQSNFEDEIPPAIGARTLSQHTVDAIPTSGEHRQSSGTSNTPGQGGGWGGYFDGTGANTGTGFGASAHEPESNPFGASPGALGGGNTGHASGSNPLAPPRHSIGRPSGTVDEMILVQLMPEKEGVFMFQHHNYEVSSQRRGSKVIRRYSDFVWLLDCLHKRYPFRALPLLPPKRVALNGNHLSNDNSFIEKRRRGLARFLNALVRHPVLSQEQMVVMFLTVPTVSFLPSRMLISPLKID